MNPELQELESRLVARLAEQKQELLSLMAGQKDELLARMDEQKEQLAALFADQVGSLHTQMQHMEDRIVGRLEASGSRLDKHGGELIAGARWISRMTEWSERSDNIHINQATRIDACEKRLQALQSHP
jgi:hypothetical protein